MAKREREIEMVKKMKALGVAIDIIIQTLGLTKEEVETCKVR